MKKVLGILFAIVLMPAAQVQAWIGGPFGHNSYFTDGDDGIYEAYATVSNGTGFYRFGVRNHSVTPNPETVGNVAGTFPQRSNVAFGGLPSDSVNIWYDKGVFYSGFTTGIANSEMGIVSGIGNASSAAQTIGGVAFVGSGTGNNVGFANSHWTAKIKQEFPIVRFNGSGEVSFLGAVDTVVETSTVTTTSVPSGTVTTTTTTSTGGEDDIFHQRGHVRKFLVYGTRVTTRVLP